VSESHLSAFLHEVWPSRDEGEHGGNRAGEVGGGGSAIEAQKNWVALSMSCYCLLTINIANLLTLKLFPSDKIQTHHTQSAGQTYKLTFRVLFRDSESFPKY
jgi:hypothetical protein